MVKQENAQRLVIGVDVGTGSARAGVFTVDGRMLGTSKQAISIHREGGVIAEQSSDDIWAAVAASVQGAMAAAGAVPSQVAGIGFDATCSLVVLGEDGVPLPVGDPAYPDRNIIVWMDHRAIAQAERINAGGHRVLDYVGGRISPEMETPKLLWLKEHRPEIYARAWQFMDLTDFLTWRASGDLARSVCTVTCKWTYLAHEQKWDGSYFHQIGLEELADEGFKRIGTKVVPAGMPLGQGLTAEAANDLGLLAGTPVGAGLIDAHAGGVGSIGAGGPTALLGTMAYVFGTSSCTMTTTADPVFVSGVWGPYHSAMVPGLWLNEGGQSAAGAAIEVLLAFHPCAEETRLLAEAQGRALPELLAEEVANRVAAGADLFSLAAGIHVVPEFLGNRAPFADPHARATIAGLGMDQGFDSLVGLYVAGLCGIGYGLRQIVAAQAAAGAMVDRIVISGGAGRHDVIRQLLADTTDVEVAAPEADEPVLLGAAILGSVAGGMFSDIPNAMGAMSRFSNVYVPTRSARSAHQERYDIFERLQLAAKKAP